MVTSNSGDCPGARMGRAGACPMTLPVASRTTISLPGRCGAFALGSPCRHSQPTTSSMKITVATTASQMRRYRRWSSGVLHALGADVRGQSCWRAKT
jgi:hypothetical protein